MDVMCGMPTIQYSARSARPSVRLSNCRIMPSLNQMICTSLHLYLQHQKGAGTPYQCVPSEKNTEIVADTVATCGYTYSPVIINLGFIKGVKLWAYTLDLIFKMLNVSLRMVLLSSSNQLMRSM